MSNEPQIPSSLDGVYMRERRAGKSHGEARDAAGHAYGHRGVALERGVARAREKFEREQRQRAETATRPDAASSSTTKGAA